MRKGKRPHVMNVFAHGTPTNFDEADSTRAIAGQDVAIRLDLGRGTESASKSMGLCQKPQ